MSFDTYFTQAFHPLESRVGNWVSDPELNS